MIVFAVYAFLAAIADGARAFSSDRAGPVAGYLLLALLSTAAGVAALAWPGITALVLTIWVAAWAFVTGIIEVAMAFRAGERAGERAMWVLTGLVSIALGVVLAIRPDIGALTLATVFGLFSIVYGISAITLGAQVRRAGKTTGQLTSRRSLTSTAARPGSGRPPDQVGEPATRRDVYRHRSRKPLGKTDDDHTDHTAPPASEDLADQAAGLDALLVDAALGRLRWLTPDASTVKFGAGLARHPRSTGRRLGGLAAEMIRIGAGTSTVGPSKRDRRFVDPAWSENPLLRRVVQAYLATAQTAEQLVSDAELGWRDEQRVRFLVENLVEALAPSNVPVLNPASAKAAIDTAGLNLVRGGLNLVRDLAVPPRVPQMVDTLAVRGRTQHRGHPRRGGPADRDGRADPVPAADRAGPRGAAADRAADDQQVLRARPGTGAQPGRVPRPERPAGVRHLLAQPGRPARRLGSGRLRSRGARRARRRRARQRHRPHRAARRLRRRHHRQHHRRLPRQHR